MKQFEKLDTVLNYIKTNNSHQYETVSEFAFDEPIRSELPIILAHLSKDGFVFSRERPKSDVHPSYGLIEIAYLISPDGLAFLSESSYKKKYGQRIFRKILDFVKQFGLFINGFLILVATLITVYFTKKASDDNDENKVLKQQVDSLKNVINNYKFSLRDTTNNQK